MVESLEKKSETEVSEKPSLLGESIPEWPIAVSWTSFIALYFLPPWETVKDFVQYVLDYSPG